MFNTRIARYTHSLIKFFNQHVLPPICILCGYQKAEANHFCMDCLHDLPSLPHHCQQCAQFLSTDLEIICGSCLSQSPPFDRTFALFPYEMPIMQLIIKLKFQHQLSIAHAFGQLFIQRIQDHWYKNKPLPDLIIPVPLHAERLKERGFNQALEIAKPIASALRIPLDKSGLKRSKPTAMQSSLTAHQRKDNVANAFNVTKNYAGLSIALIDDVITTGQTISACCHALKKAGIKQLDVWCCARRG